jgi:hypothetical protein
MVTGCQKVIPPVVCTNTAGVDVVNFAGRQSSSPCLGTNTETLSITDNSDAIGKETKVTGVDHEESQAKVTGCKKVVPTVNARKCKVTQTDISYVVNNQTAVTNCQNVESPVTGKINDVNNDGNTASQIMVTGVNSGEVLQASLNDNVNPVEEVIILDSEEEDNQPEQHSSRQTRRQTNHYRPADYYQVSQHCRTRVHQPVKKRCFPTTNVDGATGKIVRNSIKLIAPERLD